MGRVITHFEDAPPFGALTIGNFDGLHKGHQLLIQKVLDLGKKENLPSLLMTFYPHPTRILHPDKAPKLILTRQQKLSLLKNCGIEWILEIPFHHAFAQMDGKTFVEAILMKTLKIRHLVVGTHFAFGYHRKGDITLLKKLADLYGFNLHPLEPLREGGQVISSTFLRKLIQNGEVQKAAKYLTRPFTLQGKVVPGIGRGKTLGFPTANLSPYNEMIPSPGVYVTTLYWHEKAFPSVTNIGTRPTFDEIALVVETHVLNERNLRLYHQEVELAFHTFLRPEKRFPKADALIAQIKRDIQKACQFFEKGVT